MIHSHLFMCLHLPILKRSKAGLAHVYQLASVSNEDWKHVWPWFKNPVKSPVRLAYVYELGLWARLAEHNMDLINKTKILPPKSCNVSLC